MKNLIDQKVVIRSYYAGNWAGKVVEVDETNGMFKVENAYRLWSWTAIEGVSLSEVANNGVKAGKICKPVPFVWLNIKDTYEILPLSDKAEKTIEKCAR